MMDDDWLQRATQDDAFGPGSDLILSLLAVAVLLLGLVGVGTGAAPAECDACDSEELASIVAEQQEVIQALRTLAAPQASERPEIVTVGEYRINAGVLFRSMLNDGPVVSDKDVVATALDDLLAALDGVSSPIKLILAATAPVELIGLTDRTVDASAAISRLYATSAMLALAYQAEFVALGVPLRCLEIKPAGFADQPGYIEAITSKGDGLNAILELRSLFSTASRAEIASADAILSVSFEPTRRGECSVGQLRQVIDNRK